jgi:hypothetical protein
MEVAPDDDTEVCEKCGKPCQGPLCYDCEIDGRAALQDWLVDNAKDQGLDE